MRSRYTSSILHCALALVVAMAITSCSDDNEPYPSLITEMAMSSSDAKCIFSSFTTDDGHTFQITNPLKGPSPNVRWRFICGYVKEDEQQARVYTFIKVPLLSDFSSYDNPRRDPTGLASIWKSRGYINLHLLPKTQGGKQAWGFLRDSAHVNGAGGTNYYLSLSHYQLDDAKAYTEDLFVGLDLDSVAVSRTASDSLIFSLRTFEGTRSWTFNAQ